MKTEVSNIELVTAAAADQLQNNKINKREQQRLVLILHKQVERDLRR